MLPMTQDDRPSNRNAGFFRRVRRWVGGVKRSADERFGLLSRFVQFGGVGASGVIVDLSFLTIFLQLGGAMAVSRILAIWIAMTWNYFGNRAITFRDSERSAPFRQYGRFVASCSLGAGINWTVSMLLIYMVPKFFLQPQLCALGGIMAGLVSNFVLAHRWVFARRESSSEIDDSLRDEGNGCSG